MINPCEHPIASLLALAQDAAPAAGMAPAASDLVARKLRFLASAYSAVWVILALYVWSVSLRLRRLSQQIRRLKDGPPA